jgi:meiotically up-regulated gene 157 (Mug157) protein
VSTEAQIGRNKMGAISRREWLKGAAAAWAIAQGGSGGVAAWAAEMPHARPAKPDRHFTSAAVESLIPRVQRVIGDPALSIIFENCFPNTLDTTVYPGTFEGKPDTYVVTGDIDAMWLRDSSAQVWPYLPLAKDDAQLRELLEGVIRRQARMILLDPYANAFMRDEKSAPLSWAVHDKTEHHAGVGERKWEVDSLCYPIRLAHGYWRATGDTQPFDAQWKEAAWTIVRTFREQQRKQGQGPIRFSASRRCPATRCRWAALAIPRAPWA